MHEIAPRSASPRRVNHLDQGRVCLSRLIKAHDINPFSVAPGTTSRGVWEWLVLPDVSFAVNQAAFRPAHGFGEAVFPAEREV